MNFTSHGNSLGRFRIRCTLYFLGNLRQNGGLWCSLYVPEKLLMQLYCSIYCGIFRYNSIEWGLLDITRYGCSMFPIIMVLPYLALLLLLHKTQYIPGTLPLKCYYSIYSVAVTLQNSAIPRYHAITPQKSVYPLEIPHYHALTPLNPTYYPLTCCCSIQLNISLVLSNQSSIL